MKPSRGLAFTFVEVLAAMAFLGILLPVIVEALTVSNRAGVISQRTAVATELAENKLNELLIDEQWRTAPARGEFEEGYEAYQWEVSQEEWLTTGMTQLTIRVLFQVQAGERDVQLTTLVSQEQSAEL